MNDLLQNHLTNMMRIRNYSSVNNRTRGETTVNNDAFRYEIARLDAKLDNIQSTLLHLVQLQGGNATPQKFSKHGLTTGEIALVRNMTTKQHCTLQMVERGARNQDVAAVLGVAENTVKLHVRAICKKMGVKNRSQAAMVARDIYEKIDPTEYEALSGGIPLDWSVSLREGQPDPYAPLYAPTRKE